MEDTTFNLAFVKGATVFNLKDFMVSLAVNFVLPHPALLAWFGLYWNTLESAPSQDCM